ncbi:MAG: Rrf2 family transcriptional regulator [Chthonomonadales bacterium]|nr:Rrf2 family transcriptional regulator [Chthonomonadales bacterium]
MTLVSQTSEYALRAMVHLALADQRRSVREIAEAAGIPTAYLGKVLKQLVRARLVSAKRGPGGGVALAEPADRITVYDIVNAVDPIEHVRRCPLGHVKDELRLCPLHERIEGAIQHVEDIFRATTLHELVRDTRPPLCRVEDIILGS